MSPNEYNPPLHERLHRRLQETASTLLDAYHRWFDPITPANILAANRIAEQRFPEEPPAPKA